MSDQLNSDSELLTRALLVVCKVFNVEPSAVLSIDRTVATSTARQAFCLVALYHLNIPTPALCGLLARTRPGIGCIMKGAMDQQTTSAWFADEVKKVVEILNSNQHVCEHCHGKGVV